MLSEDPVKDCVVRTVYYIAVPVFLTLMSLGMFLKGNTATGIVFAVLAVVAVFVFTPITPLYGMIWNRCGYEKISGVESEIYPDRSNQCPSTFLR